MMSIIRDYFLISPAIFAVLIALNSSSQAAVPTQADRQKPPLTQVADTQSQPSDVKPTDWAFQALQSLVKNYGCAGYPNEKFPGNQAITRDEFAVALNACLNRVNELIATTANSDAVKQEDLVNIKKLQQAFSVELAKLSGDDAVLANQSSPTTKPDNSNAHLQSQVTKLPTQIPEKETTVAPIEIKQLPAKTETVAVPVPGTVEISANKLQPISPTSDSPVSQAPATVPSATPTPAKKRKYQFSYLGVGVNFGSGGDTSALGGTSLATFTKFALRDFQKIKPPNLGAVAKNINKPFAQIW